MALPLDLYGLLLFLQVVHQKLMQHLEVKLQ